MSNESIEVPTPSPTVHIDDGTEGAEEHEYDAITVLSLNITLICCVLLGYYIRVNKIYSMPESAASLLVGVIVGGLVRLFARDWTLFVFQPEVFFFVMLPPIIFEAGYSLQRKNFFENIGAICLYAMFGTLISTFIVGYMTYYFAKWGIISGVDTDSPMEALLFGALISAVDPVATLSIMGSPELQCDKLLYSLVFGESVLNDAIAIVLFKTFLGYYIVNNDDSSHTQQIQLMQMLLAFIVTSFLSILVGIALGLLCSYIYKHTRIKNYPHLEMALLFLFCYGCYATAEALELSGIMALFFNGIVLRHYNSYNLSRKANVTAEHIFGTLGVISETLVFLYMGMGVFTGRYTTWSFLFPIFSLIFCVIGRAANIFPLSFLANQCRRNARKSKITMNRQFVLWFAGLRGAIAFALSENMPGPNRDNYVTATLFICIFTTCVCGGYTERILTAMGMKTDLREKDGDEDEEEEYNLIAYSPLAAEIANDISSTVQEGVKGAWSEFDNNHLKPLFGGQIKEQVIRMQDFERSEANIPIVNEDYTAGPNSDKRESGFELKAMPERHPSQNGLAAGDVATIQSV